MIIKGGAAQSIKFWAKHLLNDEANELAEVREVRGTLSQDLEGALWEMKEVADGSRCGKNFLYQANINPRPGENLTPEQWRLAIDTLERNLGLEGHQRVVVEHIKHGRQHFHIVWNRVDQDTLRVTDIGGDRYTMRRTANQLEQEFGLSRTKPVRDYDDSRPASLWELNRSRASGVDPKAMTAELTEIWHNSDSSKAFIAAVEDHGYKIAKGDRRDFVIVDHAGDAHSLARRLDGVKVAGVRTRFADVDRDSLSNVAEARDAQRNRFMDEGGNFDRDAAERTWAANLEANIIGAEKAKDDRQQDALRHPVFDRDGQDRAWQASIEDGAIAHSEAEHVRIQEGWKQLRAAYAKDQQADDRDLADGGQPFGEVWRGVVAEEREQERLQHSVPNGSRATAISGRDDGRDAGMLSVTNAATNVVMGLADFLIGIFDSSPPAPMSREERGLAERRSERALDNMQRDLDRGQPFRDQDVTALTHHHKHQIREQGDSYVRNLLAQRDRARQRSLGNELER